MKKHVKVKALKFLIIATFMEVCLGYKILVVFPNPSRSHGNLGDGLVRHLLKAGHQVTYITPFVKNAAQQNLTYIEVSTTSKIYTDHPLSIEKLMEKKSNLDQHGIFNLMRNITEEAFDNENLKNFLEDPSQSFDVVIAQWLFNELNSGFAAVFQCPYIWLFPFQPNFVATSLIDESTNPAYAANLELNTAPPLNFFERVRNLWFQVSYTLQYYYYYDGIEKAIYDRVFGPILLKKHESIVPYDTLRYNASLMLSYSHSSIGQSLSIPQNLIPVAGYHVDEDPAPLVEDLKNIMDNAKEGVIYFSMGSNLKSKSFPKYVLQYLIKVFSEIKYTVLWKFEEDISNCSNNVHILKWAPQQSILAHPNCILFITHGGLLSTVEAIHYGTPIVGIPVFYDQFSNVDRAVKAGYAKKVMLSHNFADDLKAAILDILSDVKYAQKAKQLSFTYHDRPVSPGASLVHYVQHVVATKGAPHLRSPALHMPWYQKIYLDLFAVVMFVIYVMWSVTQLVIRSRQHRVNATKKKAV